MTGQPAAVENSLEPPSNVRPGAACDPADPVAVRCLRDGNSGSPPSLFVNIRSGFVSGSRGGNHAGVRHLASG